MFLPAGVAQLQRRHDGGGPYGGTNLVVNSRNYTLWAGSGSFVAVVQAGQGPNGEDACTIGDDSGALEYPSKYYDNTVGDTLSWTARYFMKKDATYNPPYPEFHLRFNTSSSAALSGDGPALQVNLNTGAAAARLTETGWSYLVRTYASDTNWWEILLTCPNTNRRYIGVGVIVAASTTLGGALSAAQQATLLCGNIELYKNTVKEDVSGGPVYT